MEVSRVAQKSSDTAILILNIGRQVTLVPLGMWILHRIWKRVGFFFFFLDRCMYRYYVSAQAHFIIRQNPVTLPSKCS